MCPPETTQLKQRPEDQPLPEPNSRVDIQSLVIDDISARRDIGISRYGTALQAFNGRDSLRDAYEEAMDLTIYLRQVMEERDDTSPILAAQQAASAARLELRMHCDLIAQIMRQVKPLVSQALDAPGTKRDRLIVEIYNLIDRARITSMDHASTPPN